MLDDLQPCTIIPLLSLEAVRALSGNDLGENILFQITDVGI
jgi:hypothetical protein